jgi:hypothetical protein
MLANLFLKEASSRLKRTTELGEGHQQEHAENASAMKRMHLYKLFGARRRQLQLKKSVK